VRAPITVEERQVGLVCLWNRFHSL